MSNAILEETSKLRFGLVEGEYKVRKSVSKPRCCGKTNGIGSVRLDSAIVLRSYQHSIGANSIDGYKPIKEYDCPPAC